MPERASSKTSSPALKRFVGWKIGGWDATMASHPSWRAASTIGSVQSTVKSTLETEALSSPTRRPTLSHDAANRVGAMASIALVRSDTFIGPKLVGIGVAGNEKPYNDVALA